MKTGLAPPCRRALSALAFSLLFLGLPTLVGGAQRSLRFQSLSARDGLSQRSVHSIVQDRRGFLWIGTQDGLNRWDGYRFTVYNHENDLPGSLAHGHVRALWEDRAGRLWIGTDGGGLDRFDPASRRFVHHRHDPEDPASLTDDRVRALLEDKEGRLWVGTSGGLDVLDPAAGGFRHYRHDPEDPTSLASDAILCLHESASGDLWIGTRAGLHRRDRAGGGFQRFQHQPGNPASLSDDQVLAIAEGPGGDLWIGTRAGLDRLDPATGEVIRYSRDPEDPNSTGGVRVRAILEDRDGRLWVGTDAGLDLFDPVSGRFSHYRHQPSDPDSLGNDHILTLFQDRGDILWIGTLGGGLAKWDPRTWHFPLYRNDPEDSTSLASNEVMAFAEDRNGGLWIGTLGGGLDRWNRRQGVFVHHRHRPDDPTSLGDDRVMALLYDRRGELWVGTFTGGLHRLEEGLEGSGGASFRRFTHDPEDPSSLAADGIMALYEDREGSLWVGTFGGGLDRFERQSETFTHFRHDPQDPTSLGSDRVTAFAEGPDGRFWVGTDGAGLQLFDREKGTFTPFRHHREDPGSLPTDVVFALHVDPMGTLWIGTQGGGLARLDRLDPETGEAVFRHYSEREGLPDSVVYGIQPDTNGGLWLSTNDGLVRFDPASGEARVWRSRHGLQGNEFSFGSHFRNSEGQLFFGGHEGFNAFFPERVEINPHPPPVVLTRFLRFDTPAPPDAPLDEITTLEIPRHDRVFSLEFAALDFAAPEANRYAYRLEGSGGDWVDLGTRRQVTYTHLAPGRYQVQVRAANGDGVWNEDGLTLGLEVLPSPWLSTGARVLYGLAAAGLLAVLVLAWRRRRRREVEYRHRLEREVEARTRELGERNRELEELNRQLSEASVTDSLTGLRNRRFVLAEGLLADASLARRSQRSKTAPDFDLLLLMIDLDRFKQINDQLGHTAGDRVLLAFSEVLRRECRDSDIVVRWGGDEFLVVGRRANRNRGHVLAERIRQAARQQRIDVGGGRRVTSTCSIGFAFFPFLPTEPDLLDWEQAVAVADRALTLAKSSGKDATVGIFSTPRTSTHRLTLRIQQDPERLAARGELEIRVFHSRQPEEARRSPA